MNDERPSRDEILMENAQSWAKRSTCSRAQVGVVISREGRPLSTGYNGAPAGMEHCDHRCDCGSMFATKDSEHQYNCRRLQPCQNVVHAEANAISFAARWGVALGGGEMHTTRVPCTPCSGLIINAGIVKVFWLEKHRDMGGWERLARAGIEVVEWKHEWH